MQDRPPDDFRPNRRVFLLGGSALVLASCTGSADDGYVASAARGSARTAFPDAVAWMEPGSRTATIAFVPFRMSDRERQAVISGRGVYPALARRDPMVEIRLKLRADAEGESLVKEALESVQTTFWHFDEPAPVIMDRGDTILEGTDLSIIGLDGQAKAGGWAVGTIRGQRVVTTVGGRSEAYTWNLSFQLSIA